ncbi:hypothetical protein NIES2119_01890 [[Phormidium ambiguum] IAM M-71]|uniref:Uncharacterized protein n=1 Tax=[Phormidium ambiguum] IAM M-71 TaxID=454136 RepID=A0A1U7ISD0_9CYAN|nr:hypothetical protein [Phormidium ambiguum]OKH40400.1 hypothetical protein NIES2119_01890 [Phormidium ambiguum IAM M-71]
MSLNRLIAGVAIAGLAVFTAAPAIPSFAGESISNKVETQQLAQRRDRDNWDRDRRWDRNDRWRDRYTRRYCYYERRGRRIYYCCRERVWRNGRYYDTRPSCQPVRR